MFTVFSKPQCTYCDQAKALLEANRLPFQVVNLDVGQPKVEGSSYISRDELLAKVPTARTMPQIFRTVGVNEHHIGGFNELRAFLETTNA